MRFYGLKTALLFLILIITLSIPAQSNLAGVKNLTVYDNPFDDGSGLVVKWTPLPNAMHIMEYRVYRGISPDSLFLLGTIPVDPIAGFAGKEMFYYDKDYHDFVSILSPKSLRKEDQQDPKSPLYKAIPSDSKIYGPLIKHYAVLSTIQKKDIYYHTQMVKVEDDKVLGGLQLFQIESLLANVLPGKRYYYSVVAVNEQRKLTKYAPLVSAIPYDNPPEEAVTLTPRYFQDDRQLNLEWTFPLNKSDIAEYHIYALPKGKIPQYQAYLSEQKLINEFMEKQQVDPENYKNCPKAMITNPAEMIGISPNPLYPMSNLIIHFDPSGKVIDPKNSIKASLNLNNMQDYVFILGMPDYFGYESFSPIADLQLGNKSDLPALPAFTVIDKPNDKGDQNELSLGDLSQVSPRHFIMIETNLTFNYDYATNANYSIIHIFFKIYDKNDNYLGQVNEYYPDNVFKFILPKGSPVTDEYHLKIGFKLKDNKLANDFYISQKIMLDPATKRFANRGVYFGKENLNKFNYLVLSKSKNDPGFQQIKKLSTTSRSFDDNIPFETIVYKGIDRYDPKSNTLLFDPTLDIGFDAKREMPVTINIFASEMTRSLKTWNQKVDSLKVTIASASKEEQASMQQEIDYYQKMIEMVSTNPDIKRINAITDPKKRMELLALIRETNLRSFAYMIIKTDGEGNFVISNIYKDANGNEYFWPIPNWFDKSKWPMIITSLIFTLLVIIMGYRTKRGKDLFIRPIAGIDEIDNAVGRATEMGRPILYVPGLSTIGDIATIASMVILGRIAKKCAEYDTRLLVPNTDYYVMPLAQEIVKEGHYEAGRPDNYDQNDIFFVSTDQFPYVAGVNGTMIREKTATNFYMGTFYAEALLMTETGNATGAIQIAGTDAVTQIPFFITTCDYTLIGEEFYAASAYLSKDPEILGTLKAQDYFKFLIVFFIVLGTILTTMHLNGLIYLFPTE